MKWPTREDMGIYKFQQDLLKWQNVHGPRSN